MPRKGKRRTITKGVYRDGLRGGYEIRVTVGGVAYSKRMPPDSTLKELKKERAKLEATGRTESPRAVRGSLSQIGASYLRLVTHLATWDDREDHLNAWLKALGNVQVHRITTADILAARGAWLKAKRSPATINHYVATLRNLYHRLQGPRAQTPCDDVKALPVPRTPITRVSDAELLAIDAKLQERERHPSKHFDGQKTRARFRVLISTGKRPCEVMRAKPGDLNLEQRVWVPRDAKGGYCPGVYLNADQVAAWQLFVTANAWGNYNQGNFARVLRKAGWPEGVRLYQARHNTWMAASERGVDLADIAIGAGHKDARLTRAMYVPVANSRLQRLSEALEGRFGAFPVVPISAPERSAQGKRR